MKVLFLDIDGVINRFKFYKDGGLDNTFDEDCIKRLANIVNETGCAIVISSTWKYSNDLMDTLEEDLFPKLPKGCVAGCTPNDILRPYREEEIQKYLQQHPEIENYVIVDDYDFELKSFLGKGHIVITDALEGLSEEDMNECIRILNTERKENGQT